MPVESNQNKFVPQDVAGLLGAGQDFGGGRAAPALKGGRPLFLVGQISM